MEGLVLEKFGLQGSTNGGEERVTGGAEAVEQEIREDIAFFGEVDFEPGFPGAKVQKGDAIRGHGLVPHKKRAALVVD